jgi:tryptophan synthase beta chain
MKPVPDSKGYFGPYGGRFVPEALMAPLEELTAAWQEARKDRAFRRELAELLSTYCGRPTPLSFAARLSAHLGGAAVYLKREDLCHTGAYTINNAVGQCLLARRMGRSRVIAETGTGQHGVAVATAAALLGLHCRIYMGIEDQRRQELNVYRMKLLGAEVAGVDTGSRTLKDAINESMRDWMTSGSNTYYLPGSVVGPHPYPVMVREFQSVIGSEALLQIRKQHRSLPKLVVACVGGGSNAAGIFSAFVPYRQVELVGVEAGGRSTRLGEHAARFSGGTPGVLHGTRSYVLQDQHGLIAATHSVAAGLDCAAVGPEHAWWHDSRRVTYVRVSDEEALDAFHLLSELEGIVPALEAAHALAHVAHVAPRLGRGQAVLVSLSGRGDKDVREVARLEGAKP